ncbi:hypothetical protein ACFVT9_32895 [Kitasatospora cineracea]|uniref:hypothetical protein n=1 Tax=Kitasatospora cineracea TaxID=88074 RepID=UPI0036DC816D
MSDGLERLRSDYPEVVASGGLAPVLVAAAGERGVTLGPVEPRGPEARLETGRGTLSVSISAERRQFLFGVHTPGFTWATGSTDDLGALVEAVSAWWHGMPLDAFEAAFPFVRLGRFARALEAGDVTPEQWSVVLESEFHAPDRELLRALHADDLVRGLFPTVTHGTLRLRERPIEQGGRHFLVDRLDGERCRVRLVGRPETTGETGTFDELVGRLRELLRG